MIDSDGMVRQALLVLAFTLAIIAVAVLADGYYRWRLRSWAQREGYRLLGFRGARLGEVRGSARQSAFVVELEDRHRRRRRAYVTFGRWLGLDFWGTTTVEWDD